MLPKNFCPMNDKGLCLGLQNPTQFIVQYKFWRFT